MKEELRLFKGFIGEKTDAVNAKALEYGLIIPASASEEVVAEAIKQYGKDGVLWNQTFHKSWDKVANASMAQLVLEQIMHYFTTYGFEALGCYDEGSVYIPAEKLEIPEIEIEKIKLTPINAYTKEEISEKLMILVTSGIALSDQTVKDVMVLSDMIDKDRFDEVSNREVRTFLYDKYNVMPKNPEAFLRYLIFKLTGATLKIQNVATYKALQASDKEVALKMLESYGDYRKLSSIFLRNKNLFLALKTKGINESKVEKTYERVDKYHVKATSSSVVTKSTGTYAQAKVNSIINKLRKLAVENHKALKPALLDNLTNLDVCDKDAITEALDRVTLFRAIRIMNMLAYRLNGNEDIVYRVRNGKSYVSKVSKTNESVIREIYSVVHDYVTNKLSASVKDKLVYLPDGVYYKAPTSEKQFVGNIPEGSYFELPDGKDLIFAVHWMNLHGNKSRDPWGNSNDRVDLDMHMMNNSHQFGWNTSYRDENSQILFSGDVTSAPAPHGATEAYSISHKVRNQAYLVTLNDFNGHNEDVPFEFIVAEGQVPDRYSVDAVSSYMVDPNKIISKFNMKITPDKRQITLGMVKADEKTKRFYFNDFAVGASGAVSTRNEYTLGALSYMKAYNEVQVTLNELLKDAGANIINTPTVVVKKAEAYLDEAGKPQIRYVDETVSADIDLSIENIDKTSIIELFSK